MSDDKKPNTDTKPESKKLRDKVADLPNKVNTAIEEGKGNSLIESIQDVIYQLITSVFNSCRLASLQMCMLTATQKKKIVKTIYLSAGIVAVGSLIELVWELSFTPVVYALSIMLSAYLADLLLQSSDLQKITKKQNQTKSKNEQKAEGHQSSDDDFL